VGGVGSGDGVIVEVAVLEGVAVLGSGGSGEGVMVGGRGVRVG